MKLFVYPRLILSMFFVILICSCSDEEIQDDPFTEEDPMGQEDTDGSDQEIEGSENCDPANFVFQEENGLVHAEFEKADFSASWNLNSDENDYSGEGYMVWSGDQYLGNPGNGMTSFKIMINSAGTYQFLWRTAVTIGNNGTEHNDTWLRFPDADDFYGQKNNSVVYPAGSGKTPNPNGASSDGWFKIYRSGNDLGFKWQAFTSDHDGHDIFVRFDSPGIYTMEISARSSGHAIDQFVLFKDMSSADATGSENFSEIGCED